jgi:hypothetical protein
VSVSCGVEQERCETYAGHEVSVITRRSRRSLWYGEVSSNKPSHLRLTTCAIPALPSWRRRRCLRSAEPITTCGRQPMPY